MPFRKVLVANRGEIAVRICRTARRLGYATVAVYSDADAASPHLLAADEAVHLGPATASESYLSIPKVLAAARLTGADAVHPGYGFLSENAAFARACADAGLTFIGPPADAIDAMGNKARAKRAMLAAGVPCVPGYEGEGQSDADFEAAAASLGYPIMVKAAAGGGGRGMRVVERAEGLRGALASARREAENAFKSGELLLEKAVIAPRHIELQIFADTHGNVVHLGERDCSVQRRHQKVLEESPSPAVSAELRAKMGASAVAAARACGYVGAGTVEMLLASDGAFYFLEMNTRLQVEHPVTEAVTGEDLVEWQLRVARGEPLPKTQEELALTGHAIEARLYAEDPARDYLPQTGTVVRFRPAGDVRFDHGVADGFVVSPHYDPMIAKVIAHGPTRDDARRKLAAALRATTLFGVVTNKAFLAAICEDDAFAHGLATTAFLGREFADHPTRQPSEPPAHAFALAALAAYLESAAKNGIEPSFIGWRSGSPIDSVVVLENGGCRRELYLSALGMGAFGRRYRVRCPEVLELEIVRQDQEHLAFVMDGVRRELRFLLRDDVVWTDDGRATLAFDDLTYRPAERHAGSTGTLAAPLDGKVIDVRVTAGDDVKKGQVLLVIEAMKMEHRIEADVDGRVALVHVEPGAQVKTRQLLLVLAGTEPEAS
jgi:geranyl-CoA carboxylase alpha subunit